MVTEKKTSHVHAALMLLYAQDAAETARPWERWEYMHPITERWTSASYDLPFVAAHAYRRKPETRVISGFTVPAPLKEAIDGSRCYQAAVDNETWFKTHVYYEDTMYSLRNKRRNLLFATEEAAIANAKAMCGIDPNSP